MAKSNAKQRPRKTSARPKKPYSEFPLSPHASGKWQKKINGSTYYFGRWGQIIDGVMTRLPDDGWQPALELYKARIDDIKAGRRPTAELVDGVVVSAVEDTRPTIGAICNRFHAAKVRAVQSKELSPRTLAEYTATTDRLVAEFGKSTLATALTVEDFERLRAKLAEQYGPVRLGNEIQKVRTVFKYAFEAALLDRPVRFGPHFTKPSKANLRKHRAAMGKKLFSAAEVRLLLDGGVLRDEHGKPIKDDKGKAKKIGPATTPLRAMILLAVNCGFGNADCGTLPLSALDLKDGWVEYARPKTGIHRRAKLWPETATALRKALAERPPHGALVFMTKFGLPWTQAGTSDAVTLEFGKRMRGCGLNGHRGFYALRHTFRTVADAAKDVTAVRTIMGHADGSIDDVYREQIDDERLVAVAEFVRAWLFAAPSPSPAKNGGAE